MKPAELKRLRTSTGLSQENFGKVLGLCTASISRYESGERQMSHIVACGVVSEIAKWKQAKAKE